MKNKGFTLIELLSVVVILIVIMMFMFPRLSSLVKNGGKTEVELIEERVLSAAKEYVNNYDTSFYRSLVR